jgi:hypothetical protein
MEKRVDTIYIQDTLTSCILDNNKQDVCGRRRVGVEIRIDQYARLFGFDDLDAVFARPVHAASGNGNNYCAALAGETLLYLNITPYGDVMFKFREPIRPGDFLSWIDNRSPGPLRFEFNITDYIESVVDDIVPVVIRKANYDIRKKTVATLSRGPEWVPAIPRGDVAKYLVLIGMDTTEARCIANCTDIMYNARDGRIRLSRRAIGPVIKSRAVRMDWGNFYAIELPGESGLPVGYLATVAYDEFLAFHRLERLEGGSWRLAPCDYDAVATQRWWMSRLMMLVHGWCSDIVYMAESADWGYRCWRTQFPDTTTEHLECTDLSGIEEIDLDTDADHDSMELTNFELATGALRRARILVTDDLLAQVHTPYVGNNAKRPPRKFDVEHKMAFYAERMPEIGQVNRLLAVAVEFVNDGHCISLRQRAKGEGIYAEYKFQFRSGKLPTIPIYEDYHDAELQALQFLAEKYMVCQISQDYYEIRARSDDLSAASPPTVELPHSPLLAGQVPVSIVTVPFVGKTSAMDYITLSAMCRYAHDYVGVLGPLYAVAFGFFHDRDKKELWLRLRDQKPFKKKVDVTAFDKSYCIVYKEGADIVALQCRMFAGLVSNVRIEIVDKNSYALRLRDKMLDYSLGLAAFWYNVIREEHKNVEFIHGVHSSVEADYMAVLPSMTFGDVIPVSRGPSIYGPQVNLADATGLLPSNIYMDRKRQAIDRAKAMGKHLGVQYWRPPAEGKDGMQTVRNYEFRVKLSAPEEPRSRDSK